MRVWALINELFSRLYKVGFAKAKKYIGISAKLPVALAITLSVRLLTLSARSFNVLVIEMAGLYMPH